MNGNSTFISKGAEIAYSGDDCSYIYGNSGTANLTLQHQPMPFSVIAVGL
jgi:hypothetical protein